MTAMTGIPHNDDAEAAVLGGILHSNELLQLVGHLETEDFFNPRHQAVFQAMRNLEYAMQPMDPVTVAAEIQRMQKLGSFRDDQGAAGLFCHELMLRVPIRENVEHYAAIVLEKRYSRDVMRAITEALTDLREEHTTGEEAVQMAVSHLLAVKTRKRDAGRVLGDNMGSEHSHLDDDLAALQRGEEILLGMPTGIHALDQRTGGYPIGVVSLVIGGTGHGKSTLLSMGARAAAYVGHVPFVYSFEDPLRFWGQRALAQESGVPTERIASRRLDSEMRVRLAKALSRAPHRRELIIPASGWSASDVIRDARRRRLSPVPPGARSLGRAVFVDYLHVMRMPFGRGIENRVQAIAETMDQLQWLAQGCGNPADACAVIVACQINRKVEDEKRAPRLDDIADSFAPAKVCKFALGINRPSKYDPSANRLYGQIDCLKRNQGDDLVTCEVVMDLATHTIRCATQPSAPSAQQQLDVGTEESYGH